VFDGSSESFEPVDVNVLLNPPFKPKIKVTGSKEIDFEKAWTITMGVYDREEKGMEPDYETKQTILRNGIITSMNMNYDDNGFTTKLTLEKLELHKA
jgi:EipB-like